MYSYQLLDEADHDVKNYSYQDQCYLPNPNGEAHNRLKSG